MAALTSAEIGSIVLNLIEDIPDNISGILPTIVDQERFFVEQYTNDTIGTSIADKYQPAIISLTSSSVLSFMESQGIGTKSVKIGDISITKGLGEQSSKLLRNDGMSKLNALGATVSFYKANG